MSAPTTRRAWFRDAEFESVLARAERTRSAGTWSDAHRRFRAQPIARWSLNFLVALALFSLLAPLLPLPSPAAMRLDKQPRAPVAVWKQPGDQKFEAKYWELGLFDRTLVEARRAIFKKWETGPWLGTDSKGRDTLSRVVWGSRTSLLVALWAALTSLGIGVLYGATAGLVGGRVDNVMMRVVDILQSVPTIFVVIFLLSFLNPPSAQLGAERLVSREQVFYFVIGAVSWLTMARVVRGQVLALRRTAFVESARTQGASTWWILREHVLPNVLSIVVVYVTLTLPSVILYEAFLSFLGLGLEAPRVSWGLLAADGAEALNPLVSYWWLIVGPAAAMGATLLALGFVGDGLRDALDLEGKAES